jgi:hypothetical protein
MVHSGGLQTNRLEEQSSWLCHEQEYDNDDDDYKIEHSTELLFLSVV